METLKINENTIQITESKITTNSTMYDYDFLVNQKAQIIKDANDYLDKRKLEIAEIDILIAECVKLGIKSKVISGAIE